ncbi:oligosaccharyl transferase subunit ost3/OST6 [Microbotryomycetes sp. JL201]|nr:oligosaccharyl transferase subunit ost3/OST6 [Microbotryomycetes sp. JL201]
MRISTAALLWAGVAATHVSAKQTASSVPKRDRFRQLASSNNGIVPLNSALYDEITATPRDYSVSIVLTAMSPQFKCAPCQLMQPEYDLVARQWKKQTRSDDNEHFFAVLDFVNGQEIYQRMNLQTAPTFQLFMPTEGPRASPKTSADTFDFGRAGFRAEAIAQYVQSTAQVPLNFSRPVNKSKLFSSVIIGFCMLFSTYRLRNQFKRIFQLQHLWAFGTLFVILLMTSGYMWNQIRRPPYIQAGPKGQVSYVTGGYSNQLGVETHIVAGIYGVLGFSAFALSNILPTVRDPVKQRLGVYLWTGISFVMFGVLINLFKIKQGGYPFKIF